MSRLTGADAYGLMEAYNNVYAPQELTEEQVWEEVETWVNSLLEEGYDLSDYTWEEMYEGYIEEVKDLEENKHFWRIYYTKNERIIILGESRVKPQLTRVVAVYK